LQKAVTIHNSTRKDPLPMKMTTALPSTLLATLLAVLLISGTLAIGCGKKDASSKSKKAAAPLKLVKTALPALKLTMQAPEGAKITGTRVVFVRKGNAFSVQIQKDIYGVKGDTLIIPFEKKLLKKKLLDKPDLQIWTKDMGGETVVLFAMTVKVGKKKYYVQSGGMGMFNRAQVDVMVKAVRTLAAN
jgi:hypothetical protein